MWAQFFAPRLAIGLGYCGGRTENTLWNLANGELEGQSPKVAVLRIGTNNSDDAKYGSRGKARLQGSGCTPL